MQRNFLFVNANVSMPHKINYYSNKDIARLRFCVNKARKKPWVVFDCTEHCTSLFD